MVNHPNRSKKRSYSAQPKYGPKAHAGVENAQEVLREMGLASLWDLHQNPPARPLSKPEGIVCSLIDNLIKYGSFTPAQADFIHKLVDQITKYEDMMILRAAETEAADPFPITDERIKVCGTVISIRPGNPHAINRGERSPKILLKAPGGWKAWGSLPSDLSDAKVGCEVEFCAAVTVSDNDPKFGFFRRPTKAAFRYDEEMLPVANLPADMEIPF